MNALRTIRLYGKLGTRFGRQFKLAVSSPAEAVHALCKMLPGFERELMTSKDRGIGYAVVIGKRSIGKEELCYPSGDNDIRIAPIIMGSKQGGFFQILLGVALAFASIAFAGPLGLSLSLGLFNLGVSMALGGVVQLLTPTPKGNGAKDKPENTPSYIFNGPINTQAQGGCVPLLIGRMIVGSAVISASISARDQAYVPTPTAISSGANGAPGGGASPTWWADWRSEL